MIKDVAIALAGKIEIRMTGEIDDGVLVRCGPVFDLQLISIRERVDHSDREVAGITFFAILASISQSERRAVRNFQRPGGPNNFIESFDAAVQVIFAVVDGQHVLMTVEGEAAFRDAIPITADDRAEVRIAFQIRIEVIEAENNIVTLPFTVRHFERCDNAAVVGDLNFSSAAIRQSIDIYVLSVRSFSEALPCYFGGRVRSPTVREG